MITQTICVKHWKGAVLMDEMKIPKRILTSLMNSISAGVVPRTGAPYIAIGREDEIKTLSGDLENVAEGGSGMRFIIGKYGSGKSFLIQLMRGYALDCGFITADADLSPERRLCGAKGMGRATFREIMKNLASKSSPDGGALNSIMTKWLSTLQYDVSSGGIMPDDPSFEQHVLQRLMQTLSVLREQVGGFDFAHVLMKYYKAMRNGDDDTCALCLRWLRGEYSTRTEAKQQLRVSSIIDDDNWYEYIKLYAVFFRLIGYKGFVVFIDECVNLYKISNRISRENNYEKILSMFNDTLQCKAQGLQLILGGTPQFLEDSRRGIYSYEALRSRLFDGRFDDGAYKNLIGPVIRLKRLSDAEMFALIARITRLHGQLYGNTPRITTDEMRAFLNLCLSRAGADIMITPREIIRDYITLLNILMQNPDTTAGQIMKTDAVSLKHANDDDNDDNVTDEFNAEDIEF